MNKALSHLNQRLDNYDSSEEMEYQEGETDELWEDEPQYNNILENFPTTPSSDNNEEEMEASVAIKEVIGSMGKAPEFGPPVNPQVMTAFESVFAQEQGKEFLEKMRNQYKIPENLDGHYSQME